MEALRGTYAIVIIDADRNELVAVRDHLGVIPLFYANTPRGLLISPSLRSLVARDEVSGDLNLPVVAEYAMLHWLDAEETLHASVRRVPPAICCGLHAGTQVVRYWQPLAIERDAGITEAELPQFDEIFSTG
jgi:asparagine synthase (glutamine-hydrolysing)